MAGGGVSGLAVALTTAGGVLLWASIRNESPVDLIKQIIKQPTSGRPVSTPFAQVASGLPNVGAAVGAAGAAGVVAGAGAVAGNAVVAQAHAQLGKPYVWATSGPATFDCSGLVIYSLRKAGYANVPRFTTYTFGAWAKSIGATKIGPNAFQAGDIVLRSGHMGIAISPTRMIHAPHPGTVVKESNIYQRPLWWGWRMPGRTGFGAAS